MKKTIDILEECIESDGSSQVDLVEEVHSSIYASVDILDHRGFARVRSTYQQ